jgi:hypothetical protein
MFCIGVKFGSLTLYEEQRLRMFQNRVLKRISGHEMVGVRGGWLVLHNEYLHNTCSSLNIIRIIK